MTRSAPTIGHSVANAKCAERYRRTRRSPTTVDAIPNRRHSGRAVRLPGFRARIARSRTACSTTAITNQPSPNLRDGDTDHGMKRCNRGHPEPEHSRELSRITCDLVAIADSLFPIHQLGQPARDARLREHTTARSQLTLAANRTMRSSFPNSHDSTTRHHLTIAEPPTPSRERTAARRERSRSNALHRPTSTSTWLLQWTTNKDEPSSLCDPLMCSSTLMSNGSRLRPPAEYASASPTDWLSWSCMLRRKPRVRSWRRD